MATIELSSTPLATDGEFPPPEASLAHRRRMQTEVPVDVTDRRGLRGLHLPALPSRTIASPNRTSRPFPETLNHTSRGVRWVQVRKNRGTGAFRFAGNAGIDTRQPYTRGERHDPDPPRARAPSRGSRRIALRVPLEFGRDLSGPASSSRILSSRCGRWSRLSNCCAVDEGTSRRPRRRLDARVYK